MEIVYMLMMMYMTSKLVETIQKRDIHVLPVKQNSGIKGRNYFIYKLITWPNRANILDVYSKLENYIVVLANLETICEKAWYLCKDILWSYLEVMCESYECDILYHT